MVLVSFQSVFAASPTVVFDQQTDGSGVVFKSSENGLDDDSITFDNFTLKANTNINEIRWVGGYLPSYVYNYGPVLDFKIAFYGTIANQPNFVTGPIKVYDFNTGIGNANEASAGNGLYNYSFVLPKPLYASANTKYWIEIVAGQATNGNWGLAKSIAGDLTRFNGVVNCPLCQTYRFLTNGDAAFSLYTSNVRKNVK